MTSRADVLAAVVGLVQNMTFTSLINNSATWVTCETKLRLWGDVKPEEQPAAFIVSHRELDEYRGLGLYRRRLELGIWCYSRSGEGTGQADLDMMMEAFESAFNTMDNSSSGSNTLGGLVYWCRIEGRVFKDPGDLDGQTLMIVPIIIEMP